MKLVAQLTELKQLFYITGAAGGGNAEAEIGVVVVERRQSLSHVFADVQPPQPWVIRLQLHHAVLAVELGRDVVSSNFETLIVVAKAGDRAVEQS